MKIDQVLLYVSTAGDLRPERETIGRAISEVPVPMGWQIIFSPLRGEPVDQEAVRKADLHMLILGTDIRAPIGFEWLTARRARRLPILFLKSDCLRTPAAEDFIRRMNEEASWQPFKNLADLRMQALQKVANHILKLSEHYALSIEESKKLIEWRDKLEESDEKTIDDRRGVTGESSILLTTERYIPSGGVLLQPQKKKGGDDKESDIS